MRNVVLAGALVLGACGKQATPGADAVPTSDAPTSTTSDVADASSAKVTVSLSDKEKHFRAFGTEPFWSITVGLKELTYTTPELPDGITFAASETKDGKGVRYAGTMDGKSVSLLIEPGKCSDGMSDNSYEWTAKLTIDGESEQGCAEAK